jgi:Protein of unknown function (DUF1549)/Protein of unknown function (DUF1553)
MNPASPRAPFRLWPLCLAALAALTPTAVVAEPISFRNEVMAVLSRGGCNQGACHGNQNGKNGFKLSLRGEDPAFDLAILTRDQFARRTDRLHPDDSLILLKATAAIPHEGAKRFAVGSKEYGIIRRWIAEGCRPDAPGAPLLQRLEVTPREQVLTAPADEVQLRVTAAFSNGQFRDVTDLCVFDPSNLVVRIGRDGVVHRQSFGETSILVRFLDRQAVVQLAFLPARPDFVWVDPPEYNYIDHHINAKLRTLPMAPSGLCTDAVFLRRAYLDTLGVPPTPEEARRFLDDVRSDKRNLLIDELLDRPEFADFWALKWCDLLRVEEKALDPKGVRLFHDWIRQSIADGKPLNEFAREIIAGRGSTYDHPEANYYRSLRDPFSRTEATSQVFLGVRLKCAKCHNHPFERWTQADYHSLAAFFVRVDYRIVENNRRDKFDKHEFDGDQVVFESRTGESVHPRTNETLPPRFLGADTPAFGPDADRLQALADWVAVPENPFFARAQSNRVWRELLGRGIVDPDDDFRASNPPVNEPLLNALATDFAYHHFDLRGLVRTILQSRTYQLSAIPNDTNRDDETNFSHALVRPLQAEQLLDALGRATGAPQTFPGQRPGLLACQLAGVKMGGDKKADDGERFLTSFGKPVRALSCDCERSDDATINQAFQLLTGPVLNHMLTAPDNRIGQLLAAGKSNEEIVEALYFAALSRPPSVKEREATLALLTANRDRRRALEDVLWGLVNAKEFLLRQ